MPFSVRLMPTPPLRSIANATSSEKLSPIASCRALWGHSIPSVYLPEHLPSWAQSALGTGPVPSPSEAPKSREHSLCLQECQSQGDTQGMLSLRKAFHDSERPHSTEGGQVSFSVASWDDRPWGQQPRLLKCYSTAHLDPARRRRRPSFLASPEPVTLNQPATMTQKGLDNL